MVLLSVKAGLRAKEIAGLIWAMVTDADGEISTDIRLTNASSKGRNGGRAIPMNRDVRAVFVALRDTEWSRDARPDWAVVYSERRHFESDPGFGKSAVWN